MQKSASIAKLSTKVTGTFLMFTLYAVARASWHSTFRFQRPTSLRQQCY